MTTPRIVCPKCGHQPPQPIGAMEACPACGVYMHKWAQRQEAATAPPAQIYQVITEDQTPALQQTLLTIPDKGPFENRVRAVVLVVLGLWGIYLSSRDLADGEINQSFMHGILLTIHEAGHVVMMPFGEFLTIAGGSFWQVALPFAIGVAFMVKNRDPFGAAVCLWWTGISLIDVAPYIYDALHPQLMLLTGTTGEDGPHDWIYLFEQLGGLRHSQAWGRFVHTIGVIVSNAAILWGALVLWRAHRSTPGPAIDD